MANEHPVKMWLDERNLTQEWLATKLDISKSYLSQILSGQRTPSLPLAVDIEKLTGITAREQFAEVA